MKLVPFAVIIVPLMDYVKVVTKLLDILKLVSDSSHHALANRMPTKPAGRHHSPAWGESRARKVSKAIVIFWEALMNVNSVNIQPMYKKTITRRNFLGAATGLAGALALGGCSGNAGSEATSEPIKIGVSIWSTRDSLGSQSWKIVQQAAEALGVELQSVETGLVSEQVVASIETMCSGGCQGIIVCNSSDTEMSSAISTCDQNGVYLSQFYRMISEEESPEIWQKAVESDHFVGSVHENEVDNGRELAQILIDRGDRTIGLIGWTVGDATFQQRWIGYQQAIDEWNGANPGDTAVLLEPIYANTSASEAAGAVTALVNSYPSLDAIISSTGGDTLVGVTSQLKTLGLTGKIDVVSTDFMDDLAEQLESGGVTAQSGGHFSDIMFSFLMTYNAIKGNYKVETDDYGYEIKCPYLFISSPEDYRNYEQYFVDSSPYTDDEIKALAEGSFESLRTAAEELSIEDVISRHGA